MRAGGFVAPVGKKGKDKVNDIIAPSVTSFRSRPYGFMSEHTPAQLSLLFIASHLEIKIFAGEMRKIYTYADLKSFPAKSRGTHSRGRGLLFPATRRRP